MDTSKVASRLFGILKDVSENFGAEILRGKKISIFCSAKEPLFGLTCDELSMLDFGVLDLVFRNRSKLDDAFVNLSELKTFLNTIGSQNREGSLNHVGFCYKVKSKSAERKRLKGIVGTKHIHLYEIPSNDFSLWLFVGDIKNPADPMLEFLPVEEVEDYYADYWLPNIHIDLDTRSSVKEIKYMTHEIFNGNRTANPSVVINDTIYQMRIWLGVVSGVNICLDLATDIFDSPLRERRESLKEIL